MSSKYIKEDLEQYININEPDEIPTEAAPNLIKGWITELINYKLSCVSIIKCMQHLNKKYFNPPLDEDKVREIVKKRFISLRLRILRKEQKYVFYEENHEDEISEIYHRLDLLNLGIYYNIKTNHPYGVKKQYWLQIYSLPKRLSSSIKKFIEANEYEAGLGFLNLEKASSFIIKFINMWVLPLPKIILKEEDFTLDNLQRKKITDNKFFKKVLMSYAKQSKKVKEIKTCSYCKVAPVTSEPELMIAVKRSGYRSKKHKDLEWWHNFCSELCFKLENRLRKT